MFLRVYKWVVLIVALGLFLVHAHRPGLMPMDTISIALLAIVVVAPLLDQIEYIKLGKAEIGLRRKAQEVEQVIEKEAVTVRMLPRPDVSHVGIFLSHPDEILNLAKSKPQLAFFRIKSELTNGLRGFAEKALTGLGPLAQPPVSSLEDDEDVVRELLNRGFLTQAQGKLFSNLMTWLSLPDLGYEPSLSDVSIVLEHANLLGTTVGIPPGSFGISVEPVQVIVSTGLTERIGSLQFAQRSDKSRAGRITIACGLPITGAWPDVKVTGTGAFVNASLDYTRSPSENCLISIDRRAREIYLMFHGKNISFLLSGAAPAAAAEPA